MFASVIEGDFLRKEAQESKIMLEERIQHEISRKSCKGEAFSRQVDPRVIFNFRFYEYSDDTRCFKGNHYTDTNIGSGWTQA